MSKREALVRNATDCFYHAAPRRPGSGGPTPPESGGADVTCGGSAIAAGGQALHEVAQAPPHQQRHLVATIEGQPIELGAASQQCVTQAQAGRERELCIL